MSVLKTIRPLGLVTALAAGLSATLGAAQDVEFTGETLRVVTNLDVGSSADIALRRLAPYVERYLPGNPGLIVEGMPGGGGTLAAANLLQRVDADGRSLGLLSGLVARWAAGEQMPADMAQYVPVGGSDSNQVLLARIDSGYASVEDLAAAQGPVFAGATQPNTATALRARLFFDAVGFDYQMIPGYRGQLAMLQAMQAGELDIAYMEMNNYLANREAWEQEGVIGILEFGAIDDDGQLVSADIGLPSMQQSWSEISPDTVDGDAYNALRALALSASLQRYYVLPPGTPENIAAVWSDALADAHADPEYRAEIEATGAIPPRSATGPVVAARLEEIRELYARPEVQAALDRVFVAE